VLRPSSRPYPLHLGFEEQLSRRTAGWDGGLNSKRDISVTFDLWETLIVDQPELDDARGRMRYEGMHDVLSRMNLKVELEDLKRGYEESAPMLDAAWRRGENPSTIDQIQLILEISTGRTVKLPNDPRALKLLQRAYEDPVFLVPPRLREDAIATLDGVKSRVSNVGLISNTGRSPGTSIRKLLKKQHVMEFFDAMVFSDEVGSRKPDRRIFEAAAKELQTNLRNIIHIGDNPEADIWGAKQVGMRAVLIEVEVPNGFKKRPNSLFALSRANKRVLDSEIRPDARISSLKEAVDFIDSTQ
jgi:putative hydrolase of the HAD superfamily